MEAGRITRKSMLYRTGVEYGDYTMNHVLGCSHGCRYPCYAYLNKKRFGVIHSYEEWTRPCLAENTLDLLDKEIPRLKDRIKSVQLCFTTDPFMYGYEDIADMSLQAIRRLNGSGIKCIVLTKGILPAELAQLSHDNEYGITLVSLNESFRERMEPGAAPLSDRLEALEKLHDMGCGTWVSMEPYSTPNIMQQDLDAILDRVQFTDRIIFGRMNYNSAATAYPEQREYYNDCASRVISFCDTHGMQCHIKAGTITEPQMPAAQNSACRAAHAAV
ncbi:MAG: radical SAM protein [Clostridia bacterium]|nr:radical SAM protein [Clostridia bacterium]